MNDRHRAFVPGPRLRVAATAGGALDGLQFAVKDLIDVAGAVTGGGNPDWAYEQQPARRHAPAVDLLLAAGANMCGKTMTDEFAFSLEGENWHYGTPLNPCYPDCLPGGSSSGSAVAVAAGLADAALGTDTGGSVRVPAAFCGIYGFRPTHGRISLDGVMPFAPDYDTIGWFARTPATLRAFGMALLAAGAVERPAPPLRLAQDIFALTAEDNAAHLLRAAHVLGVAGVANAFATTPEDSLACYHVLQGAQIRHSLGQWIERRRPHFGPSIAPRFAAIAGIDDEQVAQQRAVRAGIAAHLRRLLSDGSILVLPTVPGNVLTTSSSPEERASFYASALAVNALAGHAGLPQLTIPVGTVAGKPAALSFVGRAGSDETLLAAASQWSRQLAESGFAPQVAADR